MVKVNPTIDVDEEELNRKLRHACPRIKRWKSRIDEADGDVHRLREQAINKSPVYVAIQRGSKNIQIRTRTKPKWWRKWIQEGKKYGFDDSFVTPIHIPSDAHRYQRQISLSKKSPQTSPRRSLPVSPIKTGIHSPVKVSVLKNEFGMRSPKKEYQKGVPLLTLTPVPLNQVLRKKARMIGQVSTIGKGRWIEQDSALLSVPGKQEVYQYDSSSETEDEREKRGGQLLNKLLTSPTHGSPTDALKRMASAKRRETPPSPKSPKRSPKKDQTEISEEESESDSHLSPNSRRMRSKIRAVGQTSLMFSPRHRTHEDLIEESEEEGKTGRDKSAMLRKMRATGTVKAALSPHKSPSKSTKSSPKTPDSIKKKIKGIGKISAAFSPSRSSGEMVDEEGNIISPAKESTPSSLGSIFRKIKTITRLSSVSKTPDASPSSISSMMTKMRMIIRLSPRRKPTDSEEEDEEEEEEGEGSDREVKRKKKEKAIKAAKVEEEEEVEDEEEEGVPKQSCFSKFCKIVCPCICKKKEPDLMEYESGSQANY